MPRDSRPGVAVQVPGDPTAPAPAPRQPATRPDGLRSRLRIIEVAIEELADHGYPGMSLQVVANRMELRKSSLFYHFKDKRDLATTAFLAVTEDMAGLLSALDGPAPPHMDQLRELISTCVAYTRDNRARARLGMRLFVDRTSAIRNVQPDDRDDPLVRSFLSLAGWLGRAREAGVIRAVDVGNAMMQIFSALLFYPAVADDVGPNLLGDDPWSPEALERWHQELTVFVCGALKPEA